MQVTDINCRTETAWSEVSRTNSLRPYRSPKTEARRLASTDRGAPNCNAGLTGEVSSQSEMLSLKLLLLQTSPVAVLLDLLTDAGSSPRPGGIPSLRT